MQEVPLMAVVEGLNQLQCEALYVLLSELDHPTLQQTNQIMVAVLKHKIE